MGYRKLKTLYHLRPLIYIRRNSFTIFHNDHRIIYVVLLLRILEKPGILEFCTEVYILLKKSRGIGEGYTTGIVTGSPDGLKDKKPGTRNTHAPHAGLYALCPFLWSYLPYHTQPVQKFYLLLVQLMLFIAVPLGPLPKPVPIRCDIRSG